jgi:hypothetical protein
VIPAEGPPFDHGGCPGLKLGQCFAKTIGNQVRSRIGPRFDRETLEDLILLAPVARNPPDLETHVEKRRRHPALYQSSFEWSIALQSL